MTKNLIMAYDYDLAGLKASRRAIELIQTAGLNVKIAKLPTGQDPADVIKNDPQVWLSAIKEAKHHIDFLIDALQAEGKIGLELSRSVNDIVLPAIKALGKKMEQAHFVAKLSLLLGIGEESIWSDLSALKIDVSGGPIIQPANSTLVKKTRQSVILDRIFGLIFWLEETSQKSLEPASLVERLKEALGGDTYEIERQARDDLFSNLMADDLKEQLREAMSALKRAELSGDQAELDKWLKRCQAITRDLNNKKSE